MNPATISDITGDITKQPDMCFKHHNDETACNSSTYNGTKCEYFPEGKYSASRCSPVNNLKKQLSLKLNSGSDLSPDDIVHIQQIRDHDKRELKTVRTGLIVKKNAAKEEKNQLQSLLRTLYVERQNHKESLRDLEEKFKLLQTQSDADKLSLDRFYKKQLDKYQQAFTSRKTKLEKTKGDIDTPQKKNLQDYDKKKSILNETYARENDRLHQVNKALLLKYNKLKQTLETKTSEISQDSTNMSNQYKIVKSWLKMLDMDEIILKEQIRNFNKSKGEYNRLIASLKLSKLHTEAELKHVSEWLNRPNTITKMDQTVADHVEAVRNEPDISISRLSEDHKLEKFKRNTVVKPNTEFRYDTSSEASTGSPPDLSEASPTTVISSVHPQHAGKTSTKPVYPNFDELFSATYHSDNGVDK